GCVTAPLWISPVILKLLASAALPGSVLPSALTGAKPCRAFMLATLRTAAASAASAAAARDQLTSHSLSFTTSAQINASVATTARKVVISERVLTTSIREANSGSSRTPCSAQRLHPGCDGTADLVRRIFLDEMDSLDHNFGLRW